MWIQSPNTNCSEEAAVHHRRTPPGDGTTGFGDFRFGKVGAVMPYSLDLLKGKCEKSPLSIQI